MYYCNLITRELWSQAFTALQHANQIILAGYSLPAGDLTLSGMIGNAVADRDVTIEIINPGPVRSRLQALRIIGHQITYIDDGMDCAQKFARRYCDEQARDLATRLRETESTDPRAPDRLLGQHRWTQSRTRPAGSSGQRPRPRHRRPASGTHRRRRPDHPDRAHLSDPLTRLPQARQLLAVTISGRQILIIDQWASPRPAGNGYRWITLVPAGNPASSQPDLSTATARNLVIVVAQLSGQCQAVRASAIRSTFTPCLRQPSVPRKDAGPFPCVMPRLCIPSDRL